MYIKSFFKRLVKGGGWGLSQGKQGMNGSDGSTFSLVGIDIFLTTYLMHGPSAYKFLLFSFQICTGFVHKDFSSYS